MTARAALLVLATLVAPAATAGMPQLVSGPDVDVGTKTPSVPPPSYRRAAMATDGDTVLAVHMSHQFSYTPLFATRIDRSGRVLTPQPIPILTRTATDAADPNIELQMLWFRGHYLVFFMSREGNLEVLRVTANARVVERTVLLPAVPGSRLPFAVATDGTEIVLVNPGTTLYRIGADLRVAGTLDLPRPYSPISRGVAYGGGRFIVVTTLGDKVVSQFLEDGALSAPVTVSEANISRSGVTRVAWTGAAFVTAWSECDEQSYTDYCLGVWTPLGPAGQAAGPVRALGYSSFSTSTYLKYDLTLTAVDEHTVFLTWRGDDDNVAFGRRYRLSGGAIGEAVNFGPGPLAALRAPGGALAVVDSRRRLAWIDQPATAALPAEFPMVPAMLVPQAETLFAAVASETEVGVVRSFPSDLSSSGVELTVLAHDGTPRRTFPLPGARVYEAAIATDGREFYVLAVTWGGVLTLHRTGSPGAVKLADSAASVQIVWTGEELLAVWREKERLQLVRLDREGRRLAEPVPVPGTEALRFLAHGDRVLLSTWGNNRTYVTLLDVHGNPIGAADELKGLNPWYGHALATDGGTDALAAVGSNNSRLFLAFRPRNGTFVAAPATPMPPEDRVYGEMVALGRTSAGFVLTYGIYRPVLPTLHAALIDEQGFAVRTFDLPTGSSSPMLVETGPDTLLLLYVRAAEDSKYGGQSRVFARTIEVRDQERERVGQRRHPP